jgi:hypothetical protein
LAAFNTQGVFPPLYKRLLPIKITERFGIGFFNELAGFAEIITGKFINDPLRETKALDWQFHIWQSICALISSSNCTIL